MSECDKCGLSDTDCKCYMYELEQRISKLEKALIDLVIAVYKLNEYVKEKKDDKET